MATITVGRKARGAKAIRGTKKAAMFGAAATTAVAIAMGTTTPPNAGALPSTFDATSTGPLFWLVNQLGVDSVTIPGVPVLGDLTINLDFAGSDPVDIYDSINANAFGGFLAYTASRANILASGSTATGPVVLAMGQGTTHALEAYQAMLASANGNTPAGYTALTPAGKVNALGNPCESGFGCDQGTNQTNLPMVMVNNYGTPNGGINARFSQLFELFGIDSVSPDAGSGSSTGLRLNGGFINVGLGYGAQADFPATANLFSLANTLMATFLPTYLLGGGTLAGADTNTIITNLGTLLAFGTPFTSYSTFAPTDLPLLEALRLPARVINLVAKQLGFDIDLPTPIADALQPALEILVNVGYTDVQTPTEGGTYNRTYDQSATLTPWLSQNPLTPAEWAQVPGDVFHALVDGIVTEIQTLFGGGSGAAPAAPAAALAPVAGESDAPALDDAPAVDAPATDAPADDASDDVPSSVTSSRGAKGGAASAKPSHRGGPSGKASRDSASNDNDDAGSHGVGGSKRVRSGDAA